jgi:hypothetical protein
MKKDILSRPVFPHRGITGSLHHVRGKATITVIFGGTPVKKHK